MAESVFLFKMSRQGTVNTSISQCTLGNTLAGTLSGKCSYLKEALQRIASKTVYCVTNSVHYFNYRAHQAFRLMFNECTMGKKG